MKCLKSKELNNIRYFLSSLVERVLGRLDYGQRVRIKTLQAQTWAFIYCMFGFIW